MVSFSFPAVDSCRDIADARLCRTTVSSFSVSCSLCRVWVSSDQMLSCRVLASARVRRVDASASPVVRRAVRLFSILSSADACCDFRSETVPLRFSSSSLV